MGNRSNASIAEELSVDEDFYSCKTTISTYDFNGIYAADSEDDRHRASSASISEIPVSSQVGDGRKYKAEVEVVTDEEV